MGGENITNAGRTVHWDIGLQLQRLLRLKNSLSK
jgi:hypothetical protein